MTVRTFVWLRIGCNAVPKMMTTTTNKPPSDARALRILAKSVYRELRSTGHSRGDIVGFTNALLELVTSEIKEEPERHS